MSDVRPSFPSAEVLSRMEASSVAQGQEAKQPHCSSSAPGAPSRSPPPSHPSNPREWPLPQPPHHPGKRQDACHPWVLKCKQTPANPDSAAFLLLDVPCIFQGRALSRGGRCSGLRGLLDTLGAQSESSPLGSLALVAQAPQQNYPFPPTAAGSPPGPRPSAPGEGSAAMTMQRGRLQIPSPGMGRRYKTSEQSAMCWAPQGSQRSLPPGRAFAVPSTSDTLPHPIHTIHSLCSFRSQSASSRQPSMTTLDSHRCPSSHSLSSQHSPPPCCPYHSGREDPIVGLAVSFCRL